MKEKQLEEIYIYLLERTERQMKKYAHAYLKERGVDISTDQWLILKRLSESELVNQRELAKLSFKDPASVTRMLDLLQKKELISREPSTEDRRAYNVLLTEQGKMLVKKVLPLAREVRAIGLEGISEEEHAILMRVLNKIHQNFEM